MSKCTQVCALLAIATLTACSSPMPVAAIGEPPACKEWPGGYCFYTKTPPVKAGGEGAGL